jgi:hypothetical protein
LAEALVVERQLAELAGRREVGDQVVVGVRRVRVVGDHRMLVEVARERFGRIAPGDLGRGDEHPVLAAVAVDLVVASMATAISRSATVNARDGNCSNGTTA